MPCTWGFRESLHWYLSSIWFWPLMKNRPRNFRRATKCGNSGKLIARNARWADKTQKTCFLPWLMDNRKKRTPQFTLLLYNNQFWFIFVYLTHALPWKLIVKSTNPLIFRRASWPLCIILTSGITPMRVKIILFDNLDCFLGSKMDL